MSILIKNNKNIRNKIKNKQTQCLHWTYPHNPGYSPHLKIFTLITSVKLCMSYKLIHSRIPGIRMCLCLEREDIIQPTTINNKNGLTCRIQKELLEMNMSYS